MKKLLLIGFGFILLIVGCDNLADYDSGNGNESSGMCIHADSTTNVYCWDMYTDESSCVINDGNENLQWDDDMDEDDCDEFQGKF